MNFPSLRARFRWRVIAAPFVVIATAIVMSGCVQQFGAAPPPPQKNHHQILVHGNADGDQWDLVNSTDKITHASDGDTVDWFFDGKSPAVDSVVVDFYWMSPFEDAGQYRFGPAGGSSKMVTAKPGGTIYPYAITVKLKGKHHSIDPGIIVDGRDTTGTGH